MIAGWGIQQRDLLCVAVQSCPSSHGNHGALYECRKLLTVVLDLIFCLFPQRGELEKGPLLAQSNWASRKGSCVHSPSVMGKWARSSPPSSHEGWQPKVGKRLDKQVVSRLILSLQVLSWIWSGANKGASIGRSHPGYLSGARTPTTPSIFSLMATAKTSLPITYQTYFWV